jgi:hypothetical protein
LVVFMISISFSSQLNPNQSKLDDVSVSTLSLLRSFMLCTVAVAVLHYNNLLILLRSKS